MVPHEPPVCCPWSVGRLLVGTARLCPALLCSTPLPCSLKVSNSFETRTRPGYVFAKSFDLPTARRFPQHVNAHAKNQLSTGPPTYRAGEERLEGREYDVVFMGGVNVVGYRHGAPGGGQLPQGRRVRNARFGCGRELLHLRDRLAEGLMRELHER